MSVTEHVLSGNIFDQLGDAVDPRHTIAWIETNVDHDVIVDTGTGGGLRVGAPRVDIADDGSYSVSLATTAGATNPTGFQYRFWLEYRTVFGGQTKKDRWPSGWFSHTAPADLKDVVAEQYVPPTYASQLTAQLDAHEAGLEDDLTTHAGGLESALTAAALGDEDALLAAAVADENSQTRGELNTAIAERAVTVYPGRDGVAGNGSTNDLAALNAIITANPGRAIRLSAGPLGTAIYQIAGHATGLALNQPGTRLVFEDGAQLRVAANNLDHYAAVTISAADCAVLDPHITGDVGSHTGSTGEWGHGIAILEAAHRAKVLRGRITKCWGDAICVGDTAASFTTGAAPADITIDNVVCDDNRRQGISLVAAVRPRILTGSYLNTGVTAVTAPGAGIAIEPNGGGLQAVTDFLVMGPVCKGNAGRGMYVNAGGTTVVTGTIVNLRAVSNGSDGLVVEGPNADVQVFNVYSKGNGVTDNTADGINHTSGKGEYHGCVADGNAQFGIVMADGGTAIGARALNNGWSGFVASGSGTFKGGYAKGNNTSVQYYGQVTAAGGAPVFIDVVSEVGSNTTKPDKAFHASADGGTTGARFINCRKVGTFSSSDFLDQATGTVVFPAVGAVKQTGTPANATDLASALTLVNDLKAKLIALGHIA